MKRKSVSCNNHTIWLISTVHHAADHRVYWKFARSLKKIAHVTLVVQHDKLDKSIRDDTVEFRGIKTNDSKLSRFLFLIKALRLIIREKPENIIFFDFESLYIIPLIRMFSPGTHVIFDHHEDFISMLFISRKFIYPVKMVLAGIFLLTDVLIYPLCDALTVSDFYLFNRDRKIASRIIKVFNFPVYQLIAHKPWNGSQLSFVYAGGLYFERGLQELIEYFAQSAFSLTLIGKTFTKEENDYLMNAVSKHSNIHYIDFMNYDKLMDILNTFDVGLLFMRLKKKFTRNINVKQFDYMMAGIPVIVRKGHVSFVKDGFNGYNIDDLSELDTLFASPDVELLNKMGYNSQNYIKKHCNWKTEEDRMISLFHSIWKDGL